MNHHINNKYVATGISSYSDSFWKAMRGSDKAYGTSLTASTASPTPICSRRALPPSIMLP